MVAVGTPDIGGSRASMCLMAAEELGIDYDRVRTYVADTGALGFNDVSAGSRVTFACGMATIQAARDVIAEMCGRVAKIWGIPADAVTWEDGCAKPSGSNAGDFEPMSLAAIAKIQAETGGRSPAHAEFSAKGVGVSFGTHVVDVEVDPETGARHGAALSGDPGRRQGDSSELCRGPVPGGAAQGVGWAINEEYVYGADGRCRTRASWTTACGRLGFADDRHGDRRGAQPGHPYGVRGVGETSIIPPMAAVANAVARATGVRMTSLPISPPKLLAALGAASPKLAGAARRISDDRLGKARGAMLAHRASALTRPVVRDPSPCGSRRAGRPRRRRP